MGSVDGEAKKWGHRFGVAATHLAGVQCSIGGEPKAPRRANEPKIPAAGEKFFTEQVSFNPHTGKFVNRKERETILNKIKKIKEKFQKKNSCVHR